MDWAHADTEIDGCIARLRDDQRAQVQMSEDAAVVIADCRRRLREDSAEIDQLEQERDLRSGRGEVASRDVAIV